ncbi:MAG: helix-turn-helix domain-containing protein [Spirulina sp.]
MYWLKQGKVKTRKEIAELLGRDESTIYRWLRKYKQEGIEGLMREKKAKGQPKKIPDSKQIFKPLLF